MRSVPSVLGSSSQTWWVLFFVLFFVFSDLLLSQNAIGKESSLVLAAITHLHNLLHNSYFVINAN